LHKGDTVHDKRHAPLYILECQVPRGRKGGYEKKMQEGCVCVCVCEDKAQTLRKASLGSYLVLTGDLSSFDRSGMVNRFFWTRFKNPLPGETRSF